MTTASGVRQRRDVQGRQLVNSKFKSDLFALMPLLNNFARLLHHDRESAADLAQETLAKAWQARRTFESGTNLKAWLFTIMRNQYRSDARRAWRQVGWDQGVAEAISAPPFQQLWSVELDETVRAMNALPVTQREALILAGLGGFSNEATAAMLRCRPTAVKSRVNRARRAVRAMVDGTRRIKTPRRHTATITDLINQMERLSST